MGGVIILISVVVPTALWADLTNVYIHLILLTTVWMGLIGFMDDYLKVVKQQSKGMVGRKKLLGQIGLGLILGSLLYFNPPSLNFGSATEIPFLKNWVLDFGRFLSNDDMSTHKKICIIGAKVWEEMFSKINPIGRELRLRNQRFTVVGVMEEKGSVFDLDRDREVIVPLTTAQRRFRGNDYVELLWCKAQSFEAAEQAVLETKTILMRRHNDEEFFEIQSVKGILDEIGKIVLILKVMLGGTAAIALIVGGVGIMNIMLVSVTERTREIGLRKAIGAKKRHILFQFLVEAVILCLVGGAMGILVGFGIGTGLAKIISAIIKEIEWPATISIRSIITAVGASSAIGIIFGLYPARKAARLQPVEALRYE